MFSIPDYLTLRLGEEAAEVAQRVGKSLAYGHDEVNVKEPSGPDNTDKLVGELNDLLAVASMLVDAGVLPEDWQNAEAQAQKKIKVVTFMAHSFNLDRIEPGEEDALEALCQRYLKADISGVCDWIAAGVKVLKQEQPPPSPPSPPSPPAEETEVMAPPAEEVKPVTPSPDLAPSAVQQPALRLVPKPQPAPPKPETKPTRALSSAEQMMVCLGRVVGVSWAQHWSYSQFKDRVEAELPPDHESREHLKECARRLMEK